jgi:hypothetical protein
MSIGGCTFILFSPADVIATPNPPSFVPDTTTSKVDERKNQAIERKVGGDWEEQAGGEIKTVTGLEALRVRAVNRALSSVWYGREEQVIGLTEFAGKPLNAQNRREILNRLDRFKQDPQILDVKDKRVAPLVDPLVNRKYIQVEVRLITTEGELRFTDQEAFVI